MCLYCQVGTVDKLPAKCPNCGVKLKLKLEGQRTTVGRLARRNEPRS